MERTANVEPLALGAAAPVRARAATAHSARADLTTASVPRLPGAVRRLAPYAVSCCRTHPVLYYSYPFTVDLCPSLTRYFTATLLLFIYAPPFIFLFSPFSHQLFVRVKQANASAPQTVRMVAVRAYVAIVQKTSASAATSAYATKTAVKGAESHKNPSCVSKLHLCVKTDLCVHHCN